MRMRFFILEKLKKKSQIGLDLSVCRFGIEKEISLSITLEAILAYLNCLLGERVKNAISYTLK